MQFYNVNKLLSYTIQYSYMQYHHTGVIHTPVLLLYSTCWCLFWGRLLLTRRWAPLRSISTRRRAISAPRGRGLSVSSRRRGISPGGRLLLSVSGRRRGISSRWSPVTRGSPVTRLTRRWTIAWVSPWGWAIVLLRRLRRIST